MQCREQVPQAFAGRHDVTAESDEGGSRFAGKDSFELSLRASDSVFPALHNKSRRRAWFRSYAAEELVLHAL